MGVTLMVTSCLQRQTAAQSLADLWLAAYGEATERLGGR